MKTAARDRHRPRRPHLPRGHRRPRTRRAGGGRGGRCDRSAQNRRRRHGVLRRRRDRLGLWRRGAVRGRRASPMGELPRPRTEIMVNLGNPELAFHTAMLPNDGVGLARMEFIISEHIGVHPMALVAPEKVGSKAGDARRSRGWPRGYASPADYFVEKLSEGVGTIAAAFYPKPVIVRLSDFKTNEYASLLGGAAFEPKEDNPMLGFRGASRYAHPAYADGFALECAALARVRDEMGLTNLKVMVPFCRRVEEAERVIEAMARHGLKRGENGLEIFVMCEIPNNVIQIDAFAATVRRLFDRLQRSDAADAGRRSRFRDRRLRFRRARSGHAGDAAARGHRCETQPPPCRHLRRGAGQLSGDRALPGRARASIRSASIQPACCAPWPSCTKPSRPPRTRRSPPNRRSPEVRPRQQSSR